MALAEFSEWRGAEPWDRTPVRPYSSNGFRANHPRDYQVTLKVGFRLENDD